MVTSRSWGFLGGSVVKNPPIYAGDTGSIPGLGRSPGEGNSNPPPYSCLENPTDRGAWWDIAHGVTKIWTRLTTKHEIFKIQNNNAAKAEHKGKSTALYEFTKTPRLTKNVRF